MENFVSEYSDKLEKIYESFLYYGIIKDDELELDFNIILRDLYDINKLLNITYLIFSDTNTNDKEKAINLSKLKDSYGNNLLTLKQAKKVVKIYKVPITNFFKKIYNRKLNKITDIQRGGLAKNNITLKKNIDKELKKSVNKIVKNYQKGGSKMSKIPEIPEIPIDLDKIKETLKTKEDNINSEDAISIYSEIYDWIFHPLWKLENNSMIGFLFPVPLDIIGSIIDAINLINPFVMIILHKVVAALGTAGASAAGGAIGTAIGALFVGVGAAVGGPVGPAITAGIWPAIGQPIIVWILDHYIDVIALFYNISRKNMGMAYLSALDAIPYFEVILDFFIKLLLKVNSKLERIYPITNKIRTGVQLTDSIITTVLEDPNALLNVKSFYKKILKKNLRKLPQFKNISDENLQEYEKHFESVYDIGQDSINCILNKKEKLIQNSKEGQSNLELINNCFNNFDLRSILTKKITDSK